MVQPSRFEGFPNVVLEAMGMGAPVVSADCLAGPADLIRDGVNGRLVPVEDIDALAEAMRTLAVAARPARASWAGKRWRFASASAKSVSWRCGTTVSSARPRAVET